MSPKIPQIKKKRASDFFGALIPSFKSQSTDSTFLPFNAENTSSTKLDTRRFHLKQTNNKEYTAFLKILCEKGILKQKKEHGGTVTIEESEKRAPLKPLTLEEAKRNYRPKLLLTFFYMKMCSNANLAFECYNFFSLFLEGHINLDAHELPQLFTLIEEILKAEKLPKDDSKLLPESNFDSFFELKYQCILKSLKYFTKNTKKLIGQSFFYNMTKTILELTHEHSVSKHSRQNQNNDLIEQNFKKIQIRFVRFFINKVIKYMNDKKFIDSAFNKTVPYMCIQLILRNELIQNRPNFNKTTFGLDDTFIQSFAKDVLTLNKKLFLNVSNHIILETYGLILSSTKINYKTKNKAWKQIKTNLNCKKGLTIQRESEDSFFRLFFLLYNQQKKSHKKKNLLKQLFCH